MTVFPDFLQAAMSPDRWPTFVLITARIGGLMLTAPGWSGTSLPRLVRTALTVVLAALLLPTTPVAHLPQGDRHPAARRGRDGDRAHHRPGRRR
ncbi:MAG: flagellar biosynthetic protein FliR [Candidatus Eisenbacteria bacterium]|nr:flagellar biosynthetic protein FliR [Candidatus Eisenbacteria bacterium]